MSSISPAMSLRKRARLRLTYSLFAPVAAVVTRGAAELRICLRVIRERRRTGVQFIVIDLIGPNNFF